MSTYPRLDECVLCGEAGWCYRLPDGAPGCAACRAEAFFERVFGALGFTLLDWQRGAVRGIYGPVDYASDHRQIEQAYIEVPKKNGKSFLLGAAALFHLTEEIEAGEAENAEAYGAAAAKDQAGIVYKASCRLIRANPFLRDSLRVLDSTKKILRKDGRGSYVVLSADGDLQDGAEPSLVLVDELHRWKTPKAIVLHDVLIAGTVSRRNSLVVEITTAGAQYECPVAWQAHERARQHIEGVARSERLFAVIHGLNLGRLKDDPAFWRTREARAQANPSHEDRGGFLEDRKIAGMLEELGEASYKRYHLNIWGQRASRAVELAEWDGCSSELGRLIDRPCYLGLDLSATTDLSALVVLFLPDEEGYWDLLPYFWVPGDPRERELRDKVPYTQWRRSHHIEPMDGVVVDFQLVYDKIRWCRENFDVHGLAYDPRYAGFILSLMKGADPSFFIPVGQGYDRQSAPVRKFLELVKTRKLRHGGHPVLRHHADCVTLRSYQDGVRFVKPDRKTSTARIDGISATVAALAAAMEAKEVIEVGVVAL